MPIARGNNRFAGNVVALQKLFELIEALFDLRVPRSGRLGAIVAAINLLRRSLSEFLFAGGTDENF
jgi:hypothetical protein